MDKQTANQVNLVYQTVGANANYVNVPVPQPPRYNNGMPMHMNGPPIMY